MPDYYILESPFSLKILALFLLFFTYLIDVLGVLKKQIEISRNTQKIILVAFVMLLYIYISDIFKGDFVEASRRFYPNVLILTVLPIFEYNRKSFDLYKTLGIIFGISVFFAIFQMLGLRHNLSTLLPELSIIKSSQLIDAATEQGLRVSGPGFSIINFSLYLGYFIIVIQYHFTQRGNIFLMIPLAVGALVLFFTGTRSAIYGLLPSILLVRFLYGKRNVKEMFKLLIIIATVSISLALLSESIQSRFQRFYKPFDASVIERFQTNYYATIGVLKESPFFGIPKEETSDVISRTVEEMGIFFGDTVRVTTTHHNQILYYFRYYGLVGVIFIGMLYLMVFRKILATPSQITKMIFLSIIVFDLQFSMAHNNKLLHNIVFWVLLSLASEQTLPFQEQEYRLIPSANFNSKKGNRFNSANLKMNPV